MVLDKFAARNSSDDISTGRFDIYLSCINYLKDNLKGLFLGEGIEGYLQIGKNSNLYFQISAHNLYLDALMSFGIIGCTAIFVSYKYYISKINRGKKMNLTLLMPFIVYLVMVNTGGSFGDYKTYMYLLYFPVYSFGTLR
jgi:O-antigen ligase